MLSSKIETNRAARKGGDCTTMLYNVVGWTGYNLEIEIQPSLARKLKNRLSRTLYYVA